MKTERDDALTTFLRKRPALSGYLHRIGAQLINYRKAAIRDKEDGYWRTVAELKIADDGAITSPKARPLPKPQQPTKGEAQAIAAEAASIIAPTYEPPTFNSMQVKKFEPVRELGIAQEVQKKLDAGHTVAFYTYWNVAHNQVLMIEQRSEYDGDKQIVNWSRWVDDDRASWQRMEPPLLPLYGLEQLKDRNPLLPTKVWLHEGAKVARSVREMLADEKACAAHPWAGELNAGFLGDAAAIHIGWPGGAKRWGEVDWSPLRKSDLVIDIVADNDKGGKVAAEGIAFELDGPDRTINAIFFDERFTPHFDLADDLLDDMFEGRGDKRHFVGPSLKELRRPITPQGWLDKLNEQYCVVTISGETRVLHFLMDETEREAAVYMRFQAFKDYYINQLVLTRDAEGDVKATPLGQYWLNHKDRRTYKGVLFEPGKEAVVRGQLNLWRGFGVTPRQGDWSLMQDHIRTILANGDEVMDAFIRMWAAWKIQNPGLPAEVALVFRGDEGTGKGVFGRALCTLFGRHSHHIYNRHHLTGNFNAHLRDCCLLFADEAFWPGDKVGESTLKAIITEPTIPIEKKGFDIFEVRNRLGLVMASNSEWVVPASIGARRFAVADISDAQKQSRTYFDALQKQLGNGGYEAMLYDLQRMDLGGWRPLGNIPQNKALHEQKILSLKPEEQWMFGLCQAGTLPNPAPNNPRRTSFEELRKHARDGVPAMKYVTDTMLGLVLKRFGVFHRGRLRGSRAYIFPPLAECRARWAELLPHTEWDDPEQADWEHPGEWMHVDEGGGT